MDELIKIADKTFDVLWHLVCKYYLQALFFLCASIIAYLVFLGFIYFISFTYGASIGHQILQTVEGSLAFLFFVFCAGFFLYALFYSFDLLEKGVKKMKLHFKGKTFK